MLLLHSHLCFSIPIKFLMLRTPHFYIKSVKAAKNSYFLAQGWDFPYLAQRGKVRVITRPSTLEACDLPLKGHRGQG